MDDTTPRTDAPPMPAQQTDPFPPSFVLLRRQRPPVPPLEPRAPLPRVFQEVA